MHLSLGFILFKAQSGQALAEVPPVPLLLLASYLFDHFSQMIDVGCLRVRQLLLDGV
jgi:hypothetical protein